MQDATATIRRRVEAQGFLGLDDRTIGQINFWLRLSPALCMAWTAIGTAMQSPTVLWTLAPFALLGTLLPGHPFDVIYAFAVRPLTSGPSLPRYPLPRRFACLLATLMIAGPHGLFSQVGSLRVGFLGGDL